MSLQQHTNHIADRGEDSIVVQGLVKKFGNFVANDHLSFRVGRGEIFGFLGANGAGKTTTIRILCGLSVPTSGYVEVAGYNAATQVNQLKRTIGYMSQRFSLYDDLTVYENIVLFGGIYGLSRNEIRRRADQNLETLGFATHRNDMVRALPLGWRQKIAFSVAMLHQPSVVFLDEPTGGVDPVTRRQFWRLIYQAASQGTTVFVTTHYMDEAEYCNRVSIMVDGRIAVMGPPAELLQSFGLESVNDLFIRFARNANTPAL